MGRYKQWNNLLWTGKHIPFHQELTYKTVQTPLEQLYKVVASVGQVTL